MKVLDIVCENMFWDFDLKWIPVLSHPFTVQIWLPVTFHRIGSSQRNKTAEVFKKAQEKLRYS